MPYSRSQYLSALKFLLPMGALLLLGLLFLKSKEKTPLLQPLPQDPHIQVYFNHNLAASYQDPYRNFNRTGDNLEQLIIEQINQAQKTIDIAVMELRLPQVVQALIAKQKSGVKVRLIIDNKYNKSLADYTPKDIEKMNDHDRKTYEELKRYPADALALLRENNVSIQDDTYKGATRGSGIMHHKFIIIDQKTIIISSGNFTTSEFHGDFNNLQTRGNPNNLVIIKNNIQLSKLFVDEFNYMWQGLFKSRKPDRLPVTVPVGKGTITVYFASMGRRTPIENTGSGMIAKFLNQSKSSIYIAVFVYSDPYLSQALEKSHRQGVQDIKVLIDPDFYRQPYSRAYDILGVCPNSSGQKNPSKHQPWSNPITTVGFPLGLEGDRGVHSKMAILDRTIVLTGSQNWSVAGNYSNDETLVAINNPVVASHYEREFQRLFERAIIGLKSLPHAEKCR